MCYLDREVFPGHPVRLLGVPKKYSCLKNYKKIDHIVKNTKVVAVGKALVRKVSERFLRKYSEEYRK